jgi:hypothetical protein
MVMIICKTVPVPVDGSKVLGHDKVVKIVSKKQGSSASACNPIDFVSGAGSVRVAQNFISWSYSSLIDFW